jgi:general stress protein 26
VAQVAEHLLSKCKALSSKSSTAKKKKKKKERKRWREGIKCYFKSGLETPGGQRYCFIHL